MLRLVIGVIFATYALALPAGCRTDLLERGAEDIGAFHWSEFGARWEKSLHSHLYEPDFLEDTLVPGHAGHFADAVAHQDARIPGYGRMGFTVTADPKKPLVIPTFGEAMNGFIEEVEKWKATGRIKASSALLPGVAVRLADGSLGALAYGMDCSNCHYYDVSSNPKIFTKMLDLGIVAITSGSRAPHDLNHLRGLLEDPKYMAGVRELAHFYVHEGAGGLPLNDRYLRFFHIYEAMALLPPERVGGLQQLSATGSEASRMDRYRHWIRLGAREQVRRGEALLDYAYKNVVFFGGAAEIGVPYSNLELNDSIARLLVQLKRELRAVSLAKDGPEPQYELRLRVLCTIASRVEAALYFASQISVEEYFAAIREVSLPANSLLKAWFHPQESGATNGFNLFSLSLWNQIGPEHVTDFSNQYQSLLVSQQHE